jgi:hypothetical protein
LAPPFEIDPAGFPMVWVEAIAAWMQWLPMSRLELERFLSAAQDGPIDHAWCGRLLELNAAVALARIDSGSYAEALLTRIVPGEAERFAARLGEGFALPTLHLSFVATTRPRRQRTLADQMLMRYGVFEWVWQSEPPGRWVGVGEPRPVRGVSLGSPERGPAAPDRPETFRSYLYGCRLIRRP